MMAMFLWQVLIMSTYVLTDQHDNRDSGGRQNPRATVKSGRIDRHRSRPLNPGRMQLITEQDVDMAGSSSQALQQER